MMNRPQTNTNSNLPIVTIYTHGVCLGVQRPGGFASILEHWEIKKHKKLSKSLYGGSRSTTKTRMELMSVIVGLEALKKRSRVTIWSGSQEIVESHGQRAVSIEKQVEWKLSSQNILANVDLWERLLKLSDSNDVNFELINERVANQNQPRCEELANNAANKYQLLIESENNKTKANQAAAKTHRISTQNGNEKIKAINAYVTLSRPLGSCPICGGLGYILRKSGPRSSKPTLRRRCPRCVLGLKSNSIE